MPNFKRKYQIESINGTGFVWKLEKTFESYLNNSHKCVAVSNATTGILAINELLGLDSSAAVVSSPFGWGGTIAGALKRNAKIIFANFDQTTFSILPESLNNILAKNKEVKAVIDVDFLGLPSRTVTVSNICRKYNIPYILDCANSFGTINGNNGLRSGYYADFAVFSLNAQKNLATGEGGIISVRRENDYLKLIEFTQHPNRQKRDLTGIVKVNQFGMNYRIHPYSAFTAYLKFQTTLKRINKKRLHIEKKYPSLINYYGEGSSPNYNSIIINKDDVEKFGFPKFFAKPFLWQHYFLPDDPYLSSFSNKIESYASEDSIADLIQIEFNHKNIIP